MHESLKFRHNLHFKKYRTEKLLGYHNLIKDYENELIQGPIVDLGCGNTSLLLNFLNTDRELIAIDNEQFQLNLLKERILEIKDTIPNNWNFIELELDKQDIPQNVYSLVICSNIFHFFDLDRGKEIGQSIANKTTKGSLIYLQVHSTKHPYLKLGKKSGFSLFFTIEHIDAIFDNKDFERIYTADIQLISSKEDYEFENYYLDEWLAYKYKGRLSAQQINDFKAEHLKADLNAYLKVMLRRK